jgi:hypothetical protein
MSNDPTQSLPPNGRLISAGMAGAAAVGLLLNHFMIESQGIAKLMILCLGPIAFFLGVGGMVDPKIVWSVGKYGKHLPVVYKVIGGVLGALGVAVTLLLLLFVYRLGPSEPTPAPSLYDKAAARGALQPQPKPVSKPVADSPTVPANPERRVLPQDVQFLTYDRPNKRWVQMDEEALQGVRREDKEGVTTLQYVEGKHALLKVLWPDVLEVGDRLIVELQGANSVEMVDLEGADANARTSLPASDTFVVVEFRREQGEITFSCDSTLQKTYYATGQLRGDEAKVALLAAALRPGFSVKKGERAIFRNAQIVKP